MSAPQEKPQRFPSLPDGRRWDAEHFAMVASSLKEGIVVLGRDGSISWANPQSELILGLSFAQLQGRSSTDPRWRVVREDHTPFPGHEHPAMVALRTGMPQRDVVMGVRKPDGVFSWILVTASPLPRQEGVVTSFIDITDRVEREREVAAMHAREQALLNAAALAIIGTDGEGIIHTFNSEAERILGYRAAEVEGSKTPLLFHDPAEIAERAGELGIEPGFEVLIHQAKSGSVESRDWTYRRKDGSTLTVMLTISTVHDACGGRMGFMGVAQDVTERRREQDELHKMALVASRTHNAVVITNPHAQVEWVNEAFTRLTGYTFDEVRGRKVGELVQGAETSSETVAAMRRAIHARQGFQVEVLNYTREGRPYWVEIDSRPYHDARGCILGYVAVETETTARKVIEDELRRSEAELRAVVAALPDTVFRISADGIFLGVHAPDPSLLLAPPATIPGRSVDELLPSHLARLVREAVAGALRHGRSETVEYALEIAGQTREFEARTVRLNEGEALLLIREVSERKALDRLKDEFLSTVSHELRTPLAAIQGTLGLLGGGVFGTLPPEARELTAMAITNAERLTRLLNDILDIEKSMRGGLRVECAPHAMAPLVRRAVTEAAPFAQQFEVSYVLHESSEAACANLDPDRLLQVLHNLLSNAAKYGDPGQNVDVRLTPTPLGWCISVENKGRPIPAEFRPRMFQRFAVADGSNHRARAGTGLGLAISRALIERMGGTIDYESTEERTTFHFELPRCDSWPEPLQASASMTAKAGAKT